jgi:hypothetical protein
MNTFWGCETEALTELSTVFGTRAARLRALIETTAGTVHATTWRGPDAEDHRRRTDEMVEVVLRLVERLRRLGELLGEEAEEQETCSRPRSASTPAGDPLGVRATPPWVPDPGWGLPPLGGPSQPPLGPMIGGPLMAKDPTAIADALPDLDDVGPWIGGPFMAPDPGRTLPAPRPVPEDEDFALDPGSLSTAEDVRTSLLGGVPVVGTVQTIAGFHEQAGHLYDGAEQMLQDSGLGAFAPLVDVARIPHTVSGAVLGEDSTFGQLTSGLDRGIANTIQTTGEVAAAIGDGDLAGAAGAAERGLYRQAGVTADVLTAGPFTAVTGTASELLGTGADLVEPVSPEAAAPLHEAARAARDVGEGYQGILDDLTDAERYYDARRAYVPLPWDQRA